MMKKSREIIYKNNDNSGKMFRKKYLIDNYIDVYNDIILYSKKYNFEDLLFKEQVYHFLHDIKYIVLCSMDGCNNIVKFKNSTKGYYEYCSNVCVGLEKKIKEKRKETCLKKYGTKTPSESDEIKIKIKKTNIKKYGFNSPLQNIEIKQKSLDTLNQNYGVLSPLNSDIILEKIKKTKKQKHGDENFNNREKFTKTMLEKYNVKHPIQNQKIKQKITNTLNKTIMEKYLDFYSEYEVLNLDLDEKKYLMKCDKNHIFDISYSLLASRRKTNTIICTTCNPIDKSISGLELELVNFIEEKYDGKIITSDRTILDGKELDIYLPELKLAFEFNGLFWHNELHKDSKYHLNKTNECEKQEIHLFHIYEDDWIYKKTIIKSMILNKIKKTPKKIFGRKTIIKDLSDKKYNKIIRLFLDENHLQGFVGSKIKIGLFYNDEIVSLMTFGKNRFGIGKIHKNEYELLRFCNKLNTNIIGGASKLFKYFLKKYKPNNIISYADRSYSNGGLYEILNFKLTHNTKESYHYIVDKIRKHRFNFRKSKITTDKDKTEHDIMLEKNIYRIYNSGHKCYVFKS